MKTQVNKFHNFKLPYIEIAPKNTLLINHLQITCFFSSVKHTSRVNFNSLPTFTTRNFKIWPKNYINPDSFVGLIKYVSHAMLTEKYTFIVKIRCENNIKVYTEIRIDYWSTHSKKMLINFSFFQYFWLSLVFNFMSLYISSFPEWINVIRFLWKNFFFLLSMKLTLQFSYPFRPRAICQAPNQRAHTQCSQAVQLTAIFYLILTILTKNRKSEDFTLESF